MWISCHIKSDSHILTEAAFRVLTLQESNIRVADVSAHEFLLSVRSFDDLDSQDHPHLHQGHSVIRAFLVAINVATFGMFYWSAEPWVHPVLFMSEKLEIAGRGISALVAKSDNTFDTRKKLDDREVQNALIIFGILAREKKPTLEEEYSKGLLLLRMNFYEFNFRREAFLCFYRGLENFVAMRILKVKKLKNELRDLQRAIASIGGSQQIVDELREVYTTRSSQVAHAQGAPRNISFEDVMKAKVFLDFVIHKTFKTQGIKILESRRKT